MESPEKSPNTARGPAATWVVLLILGCLALRAPGFADAFDGPDAWRQADTAAIARNFLEDPRILWPRVDWGRPGPGYVESEFQLFAYVAHLGYRVFGAHAVIGQLLALLATGLAGLVLLRLARRFMPPGPALGAMVFFLMSPLVFRYSRTFMPDTLALMFALFAMERFLVAVSDPRWRTTLTAAVAMALAILIKPTAIHLGLVLIIAGVAHLGASVLRWPSVGHVVLFVAVSLGPVVAFYAHAAEIHAHYGNTFGVLTGGDPKWGSWDVWVDPAFYRNLVKFEVLWVAGPGVAALALLGLFKHRAPGWRPWVFGWALAFVLYVFIVGRYAGFPRGLHYHLGAAPLFALGAGGALAHLATWARGARWVAAAVVVGVGLQLPIDWHVTRQQGLPVLAAAGRALGAHAPADALVAVVAFDVAHDHGVANNYQQPNVLYAADRHGVVLAADQQSAARLRNLVAHRVHWLVTFSALDRAADPGFAEALAAHWRVVEAGPGYTIHAFEPVDGAPRAPHAGP